jgi:hypothetical protein
MVIRKFDPLSCAKIVGTLYAVLGLFFGAIFSLVSLAGGFASDTSGMPGLAAMLGVGAIVIGPLFYGCLGFVTSLIGALLYNLVAGAVGGIEIEIQ